MHSVAIRNTCIITLFLFGMAVMYRHKNEACPTPPDHITAFLAYAILSTWIMFCALMLSDSPALSLSEFRGEWATAGAGLISAYIIGRIAIEDLKDWFDAKRILMATSLGLALPGIWKLITAFYYAHDNSAAIFGDAPYLSRASLSFTIDLLNPIILSDLLSRLVIGKSLLPISHRSLALALSGVIGLTYVAATRYGTFNVTILSIICTGIVLFKYRQRASAPARAAIAAIALAGLLGFIKISYDTDSRWKQFGDSVSAGLATTTHFAWLNSQVPLPLDSKGQAVDHSAYMRTAWIKEGILAIVDYPLGVGYSRNAFGHALKKKYGTGQGDSHNGIINITLSTGIPGALLWFCWLAAIVRIGWTSFRKHNNPAGLALLFIILSYTLRMLMDGNTRDHPFEQFMFLTGLFSALSLESNQNDAKNQ